MKVLKHITFIISILLICSSAFAQTSIITFAPAGIINKIRAKYETTINTNVSVGSYFNIYFGTYSGLRLDPFVRFYPLGNAPKGLFAQAKVVAGFFNTNLNYTYESITDTITIKSNRSFPTYGAGIAVGYQFLVGKHKMPFDLYLGFQYAKFTAPKTTMKDGVEYTTTDDFNWYVIGPGSLFNANFGMGFSF